MSLPHAVIIAGGEGRRLGWVRKADLRIGGIRLIDRVAAALGPVAAPLLVAAGPHVTVPRMPEGSVAVPDLAADCAGPLAGIAAAVTALRARGIVDGMLVSVAVDTPFLPPDYVQRLVAALAHCPVAYAGWGGAFYPPNAAWRIEAIADLPERVAAPDGPSSPKALQRALGAAVVDWQDTAGTNPFLNINTVADLVALGHLAKSPQGPSQVIHKPGN